MKKLFYFIILCTSVLTTVQAQVFPITVQPQVKAPAPVTWYSYAETTANSPVTVRLFFTTARLEGRQLRLKLHLKGRGLAAQSVDVVSGATPIFAAAGGSLVLTNTELAPYFALQNLQGISPGMYGSAIPPGTYQFCFEVFDMFNGNRVSAETCATVFIVKNDPPILNVPLKESVLTPSTAEHIVFQWTPRHISASNVTYTLRIVEVWDTNVDPQTAFLASIPFFETTTRSTSFRYGPAQPLLLPNKRYAWQVQAKSLQGLEEIGVFENQGKSEIFWFTRAEPCLPPANVHGEPHGNSKINLFWDADPTLYSEYTISYREANQEHALWFSKTTNSTWVTLWNLKPDTEYEYKLQGKCVFGKSSFSPTQKVKTGKLFDENAQYNCGIVPDAIAITNRTPKQNLLIFDRFSAGDFEVVITDIASETAGRITGEGFVRIPYFENARFAVRFTNILINTDMQLAAGEVVTVYDANFGAGEEMTVDVTIDIDKAINGDGGETTAVSVPFIIDRIEKNKDGALVIIGTNGEEAIIPGGERVTLTDNNGTGTPYTIDEEGNVTKSELAPGGEATTATTAGMGKEHANSITIDGVRVDFQKSGYYYFDAKPENSSVDFKKQYNVLELPDGDHYVQPYKALSGFQTDIIQAKATITDTTYTTKDIVFKTKEGVLVESTWNGNMATLQLKKQFEYAVEDILAVVPSQEEHNKFVVVGAFSLMSLHTIKDIPVTIVPINGASVSSTLGSQINEIYKKAGVAFDITIAPSVQIPASLWNNDVLDIGDSGILSTYTAEERAINNYIKALPNYNENSSYMLVFGSDVPTSTSSTQGFMPLKGQFGYAFNPTNPLKTIAHELGHGVFGLKHPYEEFGIAEGVTDYLMDKGDGTVLNHTDWKRMHEPGIQINWFQKDESGELASSNELAFTDTELFNPDIGNLLPKSINCVSPAGVVVQLPVGATPFFLGHNNDLNIAEGVLAGFVLDGETYRGKKIDKTSMFTGYKKDGSDTPYEFKAITETTVLVTLAYDVLKVFCGKLLITGEYTSVNQNTTGVGPLLRNQDIQLTSVLQGHPDLVNIQNNCLPEIGRTDFDNYEFGKFNFFGKKGFLRAVKNVQGSISYVYSNIDNEGDLYQLQYLPDDGQWYYVATPSFNCTSCDLNRLFMALYNPREIGHFILDTGGMVPFVGEAFDAVNGVWYLIEGDGVNAAISFASTIPFVYLTTAKHIGKIVKLADGGYTIVKFGGNSTEFLRQLKQLDLDANTFKLLDADFANKEFADALAKNPELLVIWKRFSSFTTSKKEWIRKNVSLLEKMSKQSNEVQDKIVDYYKTFQKPSTSGSPPFQFTTKSNHIVQFDEFAQPRFEPFIPRMKGNGKVVYNPEKVSDLPGKNFSKLMGSNGHDIADANRWIKQEFPDKVDVLSNGQVKILNENDEWITCVWHHHEDGRNIIPVPIEIHNRPLGGASHTGGNSIIDKGLKDFFDSLKLEN